MAKESAVFELDDTLAWLAQFLTDSVVDFAISAKIVAPEELAH